MQPTSIASDGSMNQQRSRPPDALTSRNSARVSAEPEPARNVGAAERLVSTLLGGALLLSAIRRPSPRGAAFVVGGGALLYRGVTGHCHVYDALGRSTAAEESTPKHVERSITIEKPAEELYRLWRDPRHLSAIFGDLIAIEGVDEGRLRWRARLPAGKTIEWTTSTVENKPGELIAWRSDPSSPFHLEGSVRFRSAPRDWGTVVTLSLGFAALGVPLAALLPRIPRSLEEHVLRRCKSLCVAGEIPTLERNVSARKPAAERFHSLTHPIERLSAS